MKIKDMMTETFRKVYKTSENPLIYFAPGRVNLIGEHTDYNGGHVFPCAITLGTYVAVLPTETRKCRFFSRNFAKLGIKERYIDEDRKKGSCFSNYPLGVVWALRQKGYKLNQGFDMVIYGNLPNSSGLSSSASIEIAVCYALNDLFGLGISNYDMAMICQYSENNFNKVNCGIMDQFAIAMGKKDHAIFLDTNTMKYSYVPVKLEDTKLIIACSNKKRGLQDSKYNERRSECEKAVELIRPFKPCESLGELTNEEFDEISYAIQDPIIRKRALHAVSENQRTIEAVEVLKAGNLKYFGRLMVDSHKSLKTNYEVTGKELDTLYTAAMNQRGVYGSRMTGAGFGGCTVSLVKDEYVDIFIENVGNIYKEKIGYEATFYAVRIGGGPRQL